MAVATLPGTHLYIQVLGNSDLDGCVRFRHSFPPRRKKKTPPRTDGGAWRWGG